MDSIQLSKFILDNGFAVFLIVGILWAAYKIFMPYIQKKLENDIANDNQHVELLHKIIEENRETNKETADVNKQLLKSMEEVNCTNKELSMTNRKLVEAYEHRIGTLECTTDKIKDDVRDINTKVDLIIRK